MSEYTQSPRIDGAGRRRHLEITPGLGLAITTLMPSALYGLNRVDELVFHLYFTDLALCGTRATKSPTVAPDSPFLCGTCAWKFELATGQDLVE